MRMLVRLGCCANVCQPTGFSQNVVHEIHVVASGYRRTVVHQFASVGPREIGFEMF